MDFIQDSSGTTPHQKKRKKPATIDSSGDRLEPHKSRTIRAPESDKHLASGSRKTKKVIGSKKPDAQNTALGRSDPKSGSRGSRGRDETPSPSGPGSGNPRRKKAIHPDMTASGARSLPSIQPRDLDVILESQTRMQLSDNEGNPIADDEDDHSSDDGGMTIQMRDVSTEQLPIPTNLF